MTSLKSEFKLCERGCKGTIVLIPGWATDYRIFLTLQLDYNYLLPIKFSPFSFKKDLLEVLNKNSIGKVSLFGWSLGGFLAAEFALRNPDRVNELILLSVRRRFKRNILEEVRLKLKENAKAYLHTFYSQWFSPADKEGRLWFKKHLLNNYLRQMRLKDLLCGLDYLSQAELDTEGLGALQKIRIFHGKEDKIAPFKEALKIKSSLPQAEFVCLAQTGHAPFLNPDFKEVFYNGHRGRN